MLTIIAAAGENNELGKNNQMIWHLPDDFKRFKEITSGNYIIMGRKTFESLPKKLPNRKHIIITRQPNYIVEDCIIVNSLHDAIKACQGQTNAFIIGGGEIYKQALEIANCIELTRVHHSFEADTFFPEIDPAQWKLTQEIHHQKDEKHAYSFSFQTFIKN